MLAILLLAASCSAAAGEDAAEPDEFSNPNTVDEAVVELVQNLSKDNATAQDAARKLATFGRRSIPALVAVLNNALKTKKLETGEIYYVVWTLAHLKPPDAGRALLPLLKDEKMPATLRNLAVEAIALETLEEGAAVLQKMATGDADPGVRKKALGQLAMMPNRWGACEKLFVDALSDPDNEVRTLAAKQCYFARIYISAADKLIELAETDPVPMVRSQSMLALSRMKIRKAVPALVRVATSDEPDNLVRNSAYNSLSGIAGINLKDVKTIQAWWARSGEKEYAKLETPKEAKPDEPKPEASKPDQPKPEQPKPEPQNLDERRVRRTDPDKSGK